MRKQFSFKDSSRVIYDGWQSKPNRDQYSSNKVQKNSWTDLRVEQIKKKYDTPSHRRKSIYHEKYKTQCSQSVIYPNNSKRDKKQPLCQSFNVNSNIVSTNRQKNYQDKNYHQQFNNQIQQNQIIVFKKIQQIKNSIANDKKKSFPKMERQKLYLPIRQYNHSNDPRVQNIDKINMKIKQILQCLHDNQNQYQNSNNQKKQILKKSLVHRSQCYSNNNNNNNIDNTYVNKCINLKKSSFQQTKILSRQQIKYKADQLKNQQNTLNQDINILNNQKWIKNSQSMFEQEPQNQNQKKWRQEFMKENQQKQKKQQKQYNLYKDKKNDRTNRQYKQQKYQQKNSRSRSCLDNFIKKKQTSDYQLNSGKKLDQEIYKIQQKIKHFQEEKRKLDIDFKPFTYEKNNKSSTNLLEKKKYQRPPLPNNGNNNNNKPKNRLTQQLNNIQLKIISGRNSRKSLESKRELSQEKIIQYQELRKKADQGIQDRRRKLAKTDLQRRKNQHTEKLVKVFCQQAQLDQEFRNAKIWLQSTFIQDSTKKWQIIQQIAKDNYNQNLKLDEIEKQFSLTEDQNNPFYSVRQSSETLQSVVGKYFKSKDYWFRNVIKSFQQQKLLAQNLKEKKIDLERKGYIILQDFVRFLNMESGKFFRNRDLILVWKRLCKKERLDFKELYEIICDKQK